MIKYWKNQPIILIEDNRDKVILGRLICPIWKIHPNIQINIKYPRKYSNSLHNTICIQRKAKFHSTRIVPNNQTRKKDKQPNFYSIRLILKIHNILKSLLLILTLAHFKSHPLVVQWTPTNSSQNSVTIQVTTNFQAKTDNLQKIINQNNNFRIIHGRRTNQTMNSIINKALKGLQ